MSPRLSPTTFTLDNMEEALEVGERVFYTHRVQPVRPRQGFAMKLLAGGVGPMTIGRLQYGSEMIVDCTGVDDSYAMSIPLHGRLDVRTPVSEVSSTPTTGAIVGPSGDVRLHGWTVGLEPVILLKFERSALESELARMLGREAVGPVRFAPTLDLADGRGLRWRQLIGLLTAELADSQRLLWNPLMSERLTSTVISGLLLAADHQYQEAFDARLSPTMPATIRRAAAFIDENLHTPITTSAVAAAVGLSVRALERGFARHLSTSPRRYLERARLAMAHAELTAEAPEMTTVAQVASRWGFTHHGRFASVYREMYGRSPVETLKS